MREHAGLSARTAVSARQARTVARGARLAGVLSAVFLSAQCAANGPRDVRPSGTDQQALTAETGVLFVNGRIGGDHLVLDPAFLLDTRASLPAAGESRHRIVGRDASGAPLFQLRFDGVEVADAGAPGEAHFSFAVPLEPHTIEQLHSLELTAGDGRVTVRTATGSAAELTRALAAGGVVTAERVASDRARLTWDAERFPQIIVRDDSGTVLATGRGGEAIVVSERAVFDVLVSDGVRSGRLPVPVR